MALDGSRDLADASLPQLLAAAHLIAGELVTRLAAPGLLDDLPRLRSPEDRSSENQWGVYAGTTPAAGLDVDDRFDGPAGEASDTIGGATPDGTFPQIHLGVEELARTVEVAQTALAGHTARLFDLPSLREELLGVPPGKNAFRNARDYLCQHLRIRPQDARDRTLRAERLLAGRTLDQSEELPPPMPVLSAAFREGSIDSSSADLVSGTIADAQHQAALAEAPPDVVDSLLTQGEHLLTSQAREVDPGVLKRICDHWRKRFDAAVDPDGKEPTEAQRNAAQGLFYRGVRTGLHQWMLAATDAQHELIKTIASAASNPRAADPGMSGGVGAAASTGVPDGADDGGQVQDSDAVAREECGGDQEGAQESGARQHIGDQTPQPSSSWGPLADEADAADLRSRAQRELDGLISALSGALAWATTSDLPSTGGARPQVLVTIDYETLLAQTVRALGETGDDDVGVERGPDPEERPDGARRHLESTASYTGPIDPQTIRTWACDADLIPVVLGGEGQVLDVGRAQRLFPARLRKAIAARDGGCSAPGCTIPIPWCQVHHIDHWEHGGPTSVANGALVCSHHHAAVHAGAWEISVRDGVPWFIPARYLDPSRRPRRNAYWKPGNARP